MDNLQGVTTQIIDSGLGYMSWSQLRAVRYNPQSADTNRTSLIVRQLSFITDVIFMVGTRREERNGAPVACEAEVQTYSTGVDVVVSVDCDSGCPQPMQYRESEILFF